MADTVSIIQVGLGPWGRNWAREVVPHVPGIDAVAWVDASPDARKAATDELGLPADRCFATLQEAVAQVEAEAVLGTVALAAHVEVAEQCVSLGKHLLIEKPFTPTAVDGTRLAAAAADAGLILNVSQNYRFYPAVTKTSALIADGALGPVLNADVVFHQHAPSIGYRYYDLENPLLGDMFIHLFDLVRLVFGREPVEVACWTWNPADSPFRHDPSGVVLIRLAGGAVVTVRGSWLSREPRTPWAGQWRIQCRDGVIGFTSRASGDTSLDADAVSILPLGGEERPVALDPMPSYGRYGTLDAFAHAVRGAVPSRLVSTAADNVKSLALMEAAIRSAAEGGAVVRIGEAAGQAPRSA